MRLSVVLLGAKCSGKTSLARTTLRCHSPELSTNPSSAPEKPFSEYHVQNNIDVLDTHANTPEQKLWLGQELARRTVKVALVAIPRNAPDTNEARVWSHFARENCPNAHVGVVVTKNDINGTAARASSSRYACSEGEQFLQDHTFENSVYDLTQCAGGADQLFYTSSQERRGTDDLRRWILDMCTDDDSLEDFGWANAVGEGRKSRRKKKKYRDQACTTEGCETCTVQ